MSHSVDLSKLSTAVSLPNDTNLDELVGADGLEADSAIDGNRIEIKPTEGLLGSLYVASGKLYEVRINGGPPQYLDRQEIHDRFQSVQSSPAHEPKVEVNTETGLPLSTPEYHQIIGREQCAVNLANNHVVCDGGNGYIGSDGSVRDRDGSELGRWAPNRGVEYSGDMDVYNKHEPNGGMVVHVPARTADDRTNAWLTPKEVVAMDKAANQFLLNMAGLGVVPIGDAYYCIKDPSVDDCFVPVVMAGTAVLGLGAKLVGSAIGVGSGVEAIEARAAINAAKAEAKAARAEVTAAARAAEMRASEVVQGPYGQTTRGDLEAAARSGGPTITVRTSLTDTPKAGRGLSTASGEGAEALARRAQPTGNIYVAQIPRALVEKLKDLGLATESTTAMGDITATEIRFLPRAAEFITGFFQRADISAITK
jgi:hypothetical protein